MAEAVGLTAAILEIMTVSFKTFEYIKGIKNATKDQERLADELASVMNLMIRLRAREEEVEAKIRAEPRLKELYSRTVEAKELNELLDVMKYLSSKVTPGKTSKIFFPSKKAKFDEIFRQIERCKTTIAVGLLSDARAVVQETRSDTLEIKENVQELRDIKYLEIRDRAIEWLAPTSFARPQAELPSLRHGKVTNGEGFIESDAFKKWLTSDKGGLWCSGMPGVGKTVLASDVLQHLHDRFHSQTAKVVGIAGLYCDYKVRSNQTFAKLVASLWRELALGQPSLSNFVNQLYQARSMSEPKEQDVLKALKTEIDRYVQVYVIIDAWDECNSSAARYLLQELHGKVNIMITSRPPDVPSEFRNNIVDIRVSEADLKAYVKQRMLGAETLQEFIQRDPVLADTIVKTVVPSEAEKRIFLLAKLRMDALERKWNIQQVLEALETLPEGLDDAYDDTLKRIAEQGLEFEALGLKVLCWVSCAFYPLKVEAIGHALAVTIGEPFNEKKIPSHKLFLSKCAGLITVDPATNHVRLTHFTVQTYLEKRRDRLFSDAHANIATTCLAYLSSIPADPITMIGQWQEKRWVLRNYAIDQWGNHARHSENAAAVEDVVLQYLKLHADRIFIEMAAVADDCCVRKFRPDHDESGLCVAARFGLEGVAARLLIQHRELTRSRVGGGLEQVALLLGMRRSFEWVVERTSKLFESHGVIALHFAAVAGRISVVKMLIDKGVDPEARCPAGHTLAGLAAKNGHIELVRYLISRGIAVDTDDRPHRIPSGQTPLLWAATFNHLDIVELLLTDGKANAEGKYDGGNTILMQACNHSHPELVELLLKYGAGVNKQNRTGQTPLHSAVENHYGHAAEIVKLLLARNANPITRDDDNRTPLQTACRKCPSVAKTFLAECGGNMTEEYINTTTKMERTTALHDAACSKDAELVRALVLRRANVDAVNENGDTPLHLAARDGTPEVLMALLDGGANINALTTESQQSPVSLAAANNKLDNLRLLLDRGAVVDEDVAEAATLSGTCGIEAFEMLIAGRQDLNIREEFGAHQLRVGAYVNSIAFLEYLLDHGAPINAKDMQGQTPLHIAVLCGRDQAADYLVSRGCDVTIRDDQNMTAFEHVEEMERRKAEVQRQADSPKFVPLAADFDNISRAESPTSLLSLEDERHVLANRS